MGLLSSIKSAATKTATVLKSTFAPSAAVATQRRIDTFGTPSKTVAATVIVGAAAAAIAAPAVIAARGGISAVASSVGKVISSSSTSTKVVAAIAAPAVIGTIIKDPTTITKAPAAVVNFEKNVFELAKDPSMSKAIDLVKENPFIAGGALLAVTGATIGTAAVIGSNLSNTSAVKENTKAAITAAIPSTVLPTVPNQLPAVLPTSSVSGQSAIPITPATQVLGKSAGSLTTARHKHKKTTTKPSGNQSMRINIFNQSKSLYTGIHKHSRW